VYYAFHHWNTAAFTSRLLPQCHPGEFLDLLRRAQELGIQCVGVHKWSVDPDFIFEAYEDVFHDPLAVGALDTTARTDGSRFTPLEANAPFTKEVAKYDSELAVRIRKLPAWYRDAYMSCLRDHMGPERVAVKVEERRAVRAREAKEELASFQESHQRILARMRATAVTEASQSGFSVDTSTEATASDNKTVLTSIRTWVLQRIGR
jgi:hypothetical protein